MVRVMFLVRMILDSSYMCSLLVGMTEEQQQAYDRLVEKRKKAAKKTTTEDAKK